MLITLNSDGSFYPKTKEAGYAFWVFSSKGKFMRYGKLKEAHCCLESEAQSVINGLHFIRNHPDLKDCKKIIINVDSLGVKAMLENPQGLKKRDQKRLRQIRGVLQKYTGKYKGRKCEVEVRHVKAHSKGETTRESINNRLDKYAKLGAKM